MLMVGSPGSGKTLLARAIPGILPEMSIDESLDVTCIYSMADALPPGTPLTQPPIIEELLIILALWELPWSTANP